MAEKQVLLMQMENTDSTVCMWVHINYSIHSHDFRVINARYRLNGLNVCRYKLSNLCTPLWFHKWTIQIQQFECASIQTVQSIHHCGFINGQYRFNSLHVSLDKLFNQFTWFGVINARYRFNGLNVCRYKLFNPFTWFGVINARYRLNGLNVCQYKLFNLCTPLWFHKWTIQIQQFACKSIQTIQSIHMIFV
jgi:Ni/Co efflux regulator RcnB